MFGTKGYRAREAAAKLRNHRKLVTEEVRASRAEVLAIAETGMVAVDAEAIEATPNSTPVVETEVVTPAIEPVEGEGAEGEANETSGAEDGDEEGDEAGDEGDTETEGEGTPKPKKKKGKKKPAAE